ncbi:RPL6 (predicted), partial [Pycnogonum litorale]
KSRNYVLPNGVLRYSRSKMYRKKASYKIKPKKVVKPKKEMKPKFIEKPIGGDKNGGKRMVRTTKTAKFYPTEPATKKRKSRKAPFSKHLHKLRKSITPGTVLILIAGRHRGKRVIFLKQLLSGLLLVTGPLKLNGCPLRRIEPSFVIATKTKVDISSLKLSSQLKDGFFKRKTLKKSSKEDGDIFEA